MRDVDAAAKQGSHRDLLALAMHAYRVKKYVGAYAAALGGLDLLVFTAGVGENRAALRSDVCSVSSWTSSSIARPSVERAKSSAPPIAVSRS